MANNDLLEATMRAIEAKPETHNQEDWYYHGECGTTFCFAGHAALQAGAPMPPDAESGLSWRVPASMLPTGVDQALLRHYVAGDESLAVQDFARLVLGITVPQRQYLFTQAETPAELRNLVDLIKEYGDRADGNLLYDAFYGPDEEHQD